MSVREDGSKLDALRVRAGLSLRALAKLAGYRGASSIQRHLTAAYVGKFRATEMEKYRAALLGRGSPSISASEINDALGLAASADTFDEELQAITICMAALKQLPNDALVRVLDYVGQRTGYSSQ